MNTHHTNRTNSKYRWLILMLLGLVSFVGNGAQFQIAALAYQIIPQFHFSTAQFSTIMNAPMLVSVFLSIIGGSMGDRFGVKRVVTVGFVISIIAVFYRIYANSYWELFFSMLLLGVSLALAGTNASKMLGQWFHQKQLGMAIGIYFMIGLCGNTFGLAVSAFFPSVYSALLTAAIAMLSVGILWFIFAKDKPEKVTDMPASPAVPLRVYLRVALKSKNVWITGLAGLVCAGGTITYMSFLPAALHNARGVNPTTAGIMASVFTIGSIFGSVFGPILVERVREANIVLVFLSVSGAVSLYCSWIAPVGIIMSTLLIAAGLLTGGILPILFSIPMRLREIGPIYAGSAGGIVCTLQLTGAYFIPLFLGKIAGDHYQLMFTLAGVIVFLGFPIALMLPRIGLKEENLILTDIANNEI